MNIDNRLHNALKRLKEALDAHGQGQLYIQLENYLPSPMGSVPPLGLSKEIGKYAPREWQRLFEIVEEISSEGPPAFATESEEAAYHVSQLTLARTSAAAEALKAKLKSRNMEHLGQRLRDAGGSRVAEELDSGHRGREAAQRAAANLEDAWDSHHNLPDISFLQAELLEWLHGLADMLQSMREGTGPPH